MIAANPFEQAFAVADLPGVVGLIVNSQGLRGSWAHGLANAETGQAMGIDTPLQIASLTKALTSLGALQLVEQGHLDLDAPIGAVLPDLAQAEVLTGFDPQGRPRTRPAARAITLRHLLTHTSGLGYGFLSQRVLDYYQSAGMPRPGSLDQLKMPLLFDPGESWEYSVATDWVGLAIEAVSAGSLGDYLAEHVLAPLGMVATGFHPALPDGAARVHSRKEGGGFKVERAFAPSANYHAGGAGLIGTAADYGRFLRAMLRGGELEGKRVIGPAGWGLMTSNQIGGLRAGRMESIMPTVSNLFDPIPQQHTGWSLAFLTNPAKGPNGRAPGSLAWAGIFNCYYWIDPASDRAGMMGCQLSPFGDPGALDCFAALERLAYC